LAHGLVQGGGECELGLPEPDCGDVFGDGDVVPGQLDDVFNVLAEDEHQDGGSPVAHAELIRVDHAFDSCVLLGLGQLGTGAATVRRGGEVGVDEPALGRPG
jgi:hypothetical protein